MMSVSEVGGFSRKHAVQLCIDILLPFNAPAGRGETKHHCGVAWPDVRDLGPRSMADRGPERKRHVIFL